MVSCGCSVSWLVECIGLPPMHSGFDSQLGISSPDAGAVSEKGLSSPAWATLNPWVGPIQVTLKIPQHFQKRVGESPWCWWPAAPTYALLTWINFQQMKTEQLCGNAAVYAIVIYYYTPNSMAQNLMDRTINIPKTTSSHQKKSAIQYHQLLHCLFLH